MKSPWFHVASGLTLLALAILTRFLPAGWPSFCADLPVLAGYQAWGWSALVCGVRICRGSEGTRMAKLVIVAMLFICLVSNAALWGCSFASRVFWFENDDEGLRRHQRLVLGCKLPLKDAVTRRDGLVVNLSYVEVPPQRVMLHGPATLAVEGGQVIQEWHNAGGELHGPMHRWYLSGNRAFSGKAWHNEFCGKWRFWHESGALAAEGRFEAGRPVSQWRFWDVDGNSLNEAPFGCVKTEPGFTPDDPALRAIFPFDEDWKTEGEAGWHSRERWADASPARPPKSRRDA